MPDEPTNQAMARNFLVGIASGSAERRDEATWLCADNALGVFDALVARIATLTEALAQSDAVVATYAEGPQQTISERDYRRFEELAIARHKERAALAHPASGAPEGRKE